MRNDVFLKGSVLVHFDLIEQKDPYNASSPYSATHTGLSECSQKRAKLNS